jgi:hypothetical protein
MFMRGGPGRRLIQRESSSIIAARPIANGTASALGVTVKRRGGHPGAPFDQTDDSIDLAV